MLRITGSKTLPTTAAELANALMHTCYLGTENSSEATRSRAQRLAGEIGGYHLSAVIDLMVSAVVKVLQAPCIGVCFDLLNGGCC